MTDDTITNPPPGWYTDPVAEADHRWWDGTTWTTQTRTAAPAPAFNPPALPAPAPQPTPQVVVPTVTLPPLRSTPRNGAATTGLVLGIASVALPGLLLSIAAFIVNGIGLRRARRYEGLGDGPVGRKRARWGLTLGLIGLLTTGAVAVYGAGQLGYGPLAVGLTTAQRAQFLADVHKKMTPTISDAKLVALGEAFCDVGRKGKGEGTLFKLIFGGPMNAIDTGNVGPIAIRDICPEQAEYMKRITS